MYYVCWKLNQYVWNKVTTACWRLSWQAKNWTNTFNCLLGFLCISVKLMSTYRKKINVFNFFFTIHLSMEDDFFHSYVAFSRECLLYQITSIWICQWQIVASFLMPRHLLFSSNFLFYQIGSILSKLMTYQKIDF